MRTRPIQTRLAQTTFPGSAALRAFESAGRLLSFKRAAAELNVTESAISHQIRRLERDLGAELFERRHRAIALTPAGRAYLGIVQQAHRDLLNGTTSIHGAGKAQIRLSLLPALAEHWLMPRLGSLLGALPDIAISVFVSSELVDLDRDEIDIAIRYGAGTWPRCRVQHLMDETVFPVAHPKLARRLGSHGAERALEAAKGFKLLQNLQHPEEWGPWLPDLARQRDPGDVVRLETSALVLRAAVEQLGVAIGRRPFVDEFLASGDLVRLSKKEITTGKGHFILTPLGRKGESAAIRSCLAALQGLAANAPQ